MYETLMLGSDFFRALPMRQRAPVMYPEISHPASVTFFVSDIVKLDSVGAVDDRPTDTKKTGRKEDLKKDCTVYRYQILRMVCGHTYCL